MEDSVFKQLQYGPLEMLPPDPVGEAVLQIQAMTAKIIPCTVHVILDEVHGEQMEEMTRSKRYAGSFSIHTHSIPQQRLDVTDALNYALGIRPNFHITLVCEYAGPVSEDPVLGVESLELQHVPRKNAAYGQPARVSH